MGHFLVPSHAAGDARKGVKGLKNLGNTCYVTGAVRALGWAKVGLPFLRHDTSTDMT